MQGKLYTLRSVLPRRIGAFVCDTLPADLPEVSMRSFRVLALPFVVPFVVLFAVLTTASARVVSAQTAPVVTDLMNYVDGVHQKMLALAKAMPSDKDSSHAVACLLAVADDFRPVSTDNHLFAQ